ncbi:PP2C family protein-serine/threonine phosphatase [Opitutus terrae]|uniref:Protein serine/threonine phosphatase n=1 Tax=Opitutus terrae (strain DSM 11246 / JCM 15787 / PB90-1) TaxID=452637 RepID=B1ZV98_OPITP|nr:protein phosphatase 2C domain-containing protein [Opitutus terrae]ACB76764.1 protein serine/threonine phosphatase [Opitutus terrae PB90-1]
MTLLRSAALSDIGRVRRQNEDRLVNDPEALLFGVADGVGGLPGGAEAAQRTIEQIVSSIRGISGAGVPDLAAIVQHANFQVRAFGLALSPSTGIGSTLTFGLIRHQVLHIAHVGDSRCYGWRPNEFVQLTEDHSVENEARLRRARGEVVYYQDVNRNALTRCMGQPGMPEVDLIERPLRAGDRYLFCTDGVTRLVRQPELGELIGAAEEPEAALREIIALAIRRGGPDNATGVMLFIDEP